MNTKKALAALLPVALTAAVAVASPANAAPSAKSVTFKGNYSGTTSVLFSDTSIKILSVQGNGSSALLGAGSMSGTGTALASGPDSLCVPLQGKGAIKGSKGTLKVSVSMSTSKGCSSAKSGPVTVAVTGKAKVTGGTGAAAGAKGTLKFTGSVKLNDTSGTQSGTFTGKVSGNLTVTK